MNVGVPREQFVDERRVGLTPAGVRELSDAGATVYVEHDAGQAAGWTDAHYEAVGATITFSPEETYGRADLVIKVLPPNIEEANLMLEGACLLSFLQLALARHEVFDTLVERSITAVGLEDMVNLRGEHPIRHAMSEIAGTLAVQVGAKYLHVDAGGRGIMLKGLPGVPAASVGIIGAGVVGTEAAHTAMALGAHVILVDHKISPLRHAVHHLGRELQTAVIHDNNLDKLVSFVDILIGAVLVDNPGEHRIKRRHIQRMKPGAVLVDVSIDQGGISETSRPTSISNPVYTDEGVIHYCVPNMPAVVPRTASRSFQNHVLPLAKRIVENGVDEAIRHPYLTSGLNLFKGEVTNEPVARAFQVDWRPAEEVVR